MTLLPSVMYTPASVTTMPDRYIWMFLTQRDVSELFKTFSKYTPWPEPRHTSLRAHENNSCFAGARDNVIHKTATWTHNTLTFPNKIIKLLMCSIPVGITFTFMSTWVLNSWLQGKLTYHIKYLDPTCIGRYIFCWLCTEQRGETAINHLQRRCWLQNYLQIQSRGQQ